MYIWVQYPMLVSLDAMLLIDNLLFAQTLLAALGCGLIAGVYFAFSTSVMTALGRLPAHQGIAAMQGINAVIVNAVFLAVFLGTTMACALIVVAALARRHDPGAVWGLIGGVLYVAGAFGVTTVWNVPLNNAPAAVVPSDPAAASRWTSYLTRRTVWNHVRTAAVLAAAAALTVALTY